MPGLSAPERCRFARATGAEPRAASAVVWSPRERDVLAERVLRRLAARGLVITDAQRALLAACEDEDRLVDWLDRESTAATVDELLAP